MPFTKVKGQLLVKSEQKIGGKDAKKLLLDAASRFSESAATALLGDRKGDDLCQRKTAGGVVCRIICCNAVPTIFEMGQSGLLPTLPGMWRAPDALPCLYIPHEAARFLINGADLLLPGVRGMDEAIASLQPGAPACVRVLGNPAAVAVGTLVSTGAAIGAAVASPCSIKGVALAVEHVLGDALWRHSGRPLANEGFVVRDDGTVSVTPTQAAGAGGTSTAPKADPADGSGAGEGSEGSESSGGNAADGDELLDISDAVSDVAGALAAKATVGDSSDAGGGEAPGGGSGVSAEEMDGQLGACFLYAATQVEDSALPLSLNAFYATRMRPLRRVGTSLDVKLSSYKKLRPFIEAMAAQGLCTLAGGKGAAEPTISSIGRRAPAYLSFEPWAATAEAADAGGGGGGGGGAPRLVVSRVYRPTEAMRRLFEGGDARRFYEEAEAYAALEAYIAKEALQGAGGWTLDPVLTGILYAGEASPPTVLSAKETRKRWVGKLERWTRVSGGLLEKPLHVNGDAPKVVLTTEQRRGHHVTMVSELSPYAIDPYGAARELQGLCGATANVEEVELKSGAKRRVVTVQGLWDRSISEWLGTRHGLPSACVENRVAGKAGHSQKKDKKATNVRRA